MEAGAIGPQQILEAQQNDTDNGETKEMKILRELENQPADTSTEPEKEAPAVDKTVTAEGEKKEEDLPKVMNQD